MKKVLFVAAFAVFGLGVSNAQEIKFGAKAGLNMATFAGDVEDAKMKMGLHIGGVVEIPLSDKFSFAPELLYSMQGSKQEFSEDFFGETLEVEIKYNTSYINIPLMAKYYVTDAFSIEAGPQVGFLMSAKAKAEASFGGESESESEDIKDLMNSFDLGLNFGVGYKLDNGLFFQARYNLGLSNIVDNWVPEFDDEGGAISTEDFKMSNSIIQISVGFMF